jgi:ligand-binding SRPBCC domain-containing protein
MWHHEHFFKEVKGGVEMTDEVTYVLPFGIFGEMGHNLFIKKQLKDIFDYRFKRVEEIFKVKTESVKV